MSGRSRRNIQLHNVLSGYVPIVLWSKVKFNFHGVVVLHDAIYWHVPCRSWRVSTMVKRYTVILYIYTVMFEICPRPILIHK
jgi:hypothetical protein